MHTFFSADFFTNNRQRLRDLVGSDVPIVVTGNGVMQRGADEPSPFHQDSNFWYLTGINAADLVLVMLAGETYLIVPSLSASREAFDGAHNLAAYQERSGITVFVGEREGWTRLRRQTDVATLGTLPPYVRAHGLHTLPYRRRAIARLKRFSPGVRLHDIRSDLSTLRAVKQPQELQALQAAIDITGQTLRDITGSVLVEATHEYEIDAALGYGFRMRGAAGHAFAPIVGAGKHSTTLHYMDNNGPITPDNLIVLDVGAEVEHYAADVTRTVSQQALTGREAAVFEAVEAIQDYALSLLQPGTLLRDYEQAVEAETGRQLQALGLIKQATHEHIRRYFPHATSHFLGLDTHDVGDYQKPLEPGMVLTCEPGIYIPEEGIGVRIEDDILITPKGHRNLSAACPRRLTPVST